MIGEFLKFTDVLGVGALGLANGNELVPGSGFPGDIREAGIDPAIGASGRDEAGKHGHRQFRRGVVEVRFASHSTYIPKNQIYRGL